MRSFNLNAEPIRWIAFDAVGTLIRPEPSVAAVYHGAGTRYGSRLSLEAVASRFGQSFARLDRDEILPCGCPQEANPLHTCETRERLRWRTIVDDVLDDVTSREACFAELFAHFGQPSAWRCFSDVEQTLVFLREAGFRLAVSSNFDARLHSVMDGLPALQPIELRVVSSQVGHRKPSADFFQSLLAAADCSPAEMIFIGDDPQNDVAAARAAGIASWRIDRTTGPRENHELRSLDEIVAWLRESSRSIFQRPRSRTETGPAI